MSPNVIKQEVHKPGPLKQVHKAHKGGNNKNKSYGKAKQSVKVLSKKLSNLSRRERKHQLTQIRKNKKEAVLNKKRQIGGLHAPPLVVTILSLDDLTDPKKFISDLKCCHDELITYDSSLGCSHMCSSQLKQRFTFIAINKFDLHSVMDSLKVADVLLLIHTHKPLDEYTENLLSIIIAHALPTPVHVVQHMQDLNPKKKADLRKHIVKSIESRFPDPKLLQADTRQERQLLLRHIFNLKQQNIGFRDKRFHLLVEDVKFDQSDDGIGTLRVSGYARGKPLSVNGLVHIPGCGSFQMSQIEHRCDPLDKLMKKNTSDIEVCLTETPDVKLQESLQSEIIPDPMEGEQTWPTPEELLEAELQANKKVLKVRDGTSEYQAAWIVESEEEESEEEESEEDDENDVEAPMEESIAGEDSYVDVNMDDTASVLNMEDETYDKNMDMDEEKKALVRFKEERMNQMFPDEEDTPIDINARIRYQKYRGLKHFATSPWDPMENLPHDYARIFRFENFKQTKKKVLTSEIDGVMAGQYITVHIKNVPQSVYDNFKENSTLVVYGLLPHEQKMSVMNVVIRKHVNCRTPVKSKDPLIFHIGYTRFTCNPTFSEHRMGYKFKLERFLPTDAAVVASFYAPVIFPPATAVVFRQLSNGSHELVATGSVLDVNPNRVIVKRVVLSGHPFKINKRSAVIRHMFFNKEDITWFKSIELRTKYGRHGHIKESLGTHGHMKCVFNNQLPSNDAALMMLYKRVYPKWTYDTYVPDPLIDNPAVSKDE